MVVIKKKTRPWIIESRVEFTMGGKEEEEGEREKVKEVVRKRGR